MTYLSEVEAEYGNFTLFTEVRWLSRGECLKRFFTLRKEVTEFRNQHVNITFSEKIKEKLLHYHFLSSLAFLTDNSSHEWVKFEVADLLFK